MRLIITPRRPPYDAQGNLLPGEWTPNGLCVRNAQGRPTIEHARTMARTLGTFKAARYLRKRGWSLQAALHILTTPATASRRVH